MKQSSKIDFKVEPPGLHMIKDASIKSFNGNF